MARAIHENVSDEHESEKTEEEAKSDEDEKELQRRAADDEDEKREREEEAPAPGNLQRNSGVVPTYVETPPAAPSHEEPLLYRVQPLDLSDPGGRRLFMRKARAVAAGAQVMADVQNAVWKKKHRKRVARWYGALGDGKPHPRPPKLLRRSEVPALYVGGLGVPAASLAGTLSRPVHGTPEAVAEIERVMLEANTMVRAYTIDGDGGHDNESWTKALEGVADDGATGDGVVPGAVRSDVARASDAA
jgi:hypothetical protein